jgi:hypothetical protein
MVRYHEIVNETNQSDKGEMRDRYREIRRLFRDHFAFSTDYEIDLETESVSVTGDCTFRQSPDIGLLPVKFSNITGDFRCSGSEGSGIGLTSLIHSPTRINGSFQCDGNMIESLEYGPSYVGLGYDCSDNHLTDLNFLPTFIGGTLMAFTNPLSSLEGLEKCKIGGAIFLSWNANLPLLRLISIENRTSFIGSEREDSIQAKEIETIIKEFKKHPDKKKAIYDCQYALIKAGFKGNARW